MYYFFVEIVISQIFYYNSFIGVVRVDNWVNLTIDPQVAASIVALRPAIETLVIRAANDPENVGAPNQQEDKTIQVRKKNQATFISIIIDVLIRH